MEVIRINNFVGHVTQLHCHILQALELEGSHNVKKINVHCETFGSWCRNCAAEQNLYHQEVTGWRSDLAVEVYSVAPDY